MVLFVKLCHSLVIFSSFFQMSSKPYSASASSEEFLRVRESLRMHFMQQRLERKTQRKPERKSSTERASAMLRMPRQKNDAALRALGFAVDPWNTNIVYLPLGWTKQYSMDSENVSLIYDCAMTHRATFSHELQTLYVADEFKVPTSLKVQLDLTRKNLLVTQDVLKRNTRQLQAYKLWAFQLLCGVVPNQKFRFLEGINGRLQF
jgi:hypothetical protein